MFASNPWPLIHRSILDRCQRQSQPAALAFLEQAEAFYRASTDAGVTAARPVLLYYCFMNLVKSYLLTMGQHAELKQNVYHGMTESLRGNGTHPTDAALKVYRSAGARINLMDELLRAFGFRLSAKAVEWDVALLLSQVVTGHRLWTMATGRRERFVAIKLLRLFHDPISKQVWLRLYIEAESLSRLGISHRQFLAESRFAPAFHEVIPDEGTEWELVNSDLHRLLCFEQVDARGYSDRPVDEILDVVREVTPHIWSVVSSTTPYRRYYAYLAPPQEYSVVLPQLASMYAVMFYLGSVTRYQPEQFDVILRGSYGPVVRAVLDDAPRQFLYLMASEFAQRDVTRAAIV